MLKVGRRSTFNSAHRLHNKSLSDKENLKIFGKCNSPNYHGHNYVLETWLEGKLEEKTGFLIDLGVLKEIINEEIILCFDHKNLNLDVEEFKNLNPTAENIAIVIYKKLKKRIPNHRLSIKLYETENNMVEYSE